MSTERGVDQAAGRAGFMQELIRNRGFVACIVLLGILTASFKVLARNTQFRPKAVPMKAPFDALKRSSLFPYELVHPYPPIKGEVLDSLGTNEYLQWLMRDTSTAVQAPEDFVHLFVTYYTGKPDQVPHVPEICYTAQGNKVVADYYDEVPIPSLGSNAVVPIKILEFEGSRLLGRQNTIVMYTFHANGQWCRDRRDVQSAVGRPGTTHAYFSKLELSFGSQEHVPDKDKAIRSGKRFLQVIVPVLLRDHWPQWPPADTAARG